MKIIKKNICLIAILSGVVGLSACSQDDALTPDGGTDNGNTIRFTTAIARFTGSDAADTPGTRATINDEDGTGSFTADDETMIIGSAYTAISIVTKEHPATYKDGTWTTDMTWDEFGEVEWVRFSAFFPKRSLADFDENGQMEINLPTDQSTPEQYAAYDWISATATGKKADQPTIELTFYHCMYRLTVNLSLSDNPGTLKQEDVDAATVVIKNMETKGVVNSGGGVVSDMNNTGDFTPLKSAPGNSFRVLLLPQDVTPGTPWIEITVGGRTVTYPVPAGLEVLRGGEEQVVNLALTNAATTAKTITLSEQKNAVTAGVGGKAEYDISQRTSTSATLSFYGGSNSNMVRRR
ncbi:fimbrillin family protein [Bacteroides thetaiotaomicron]|uniref:fimbrillin family protein n=1 Tax=Bacteroides thetaiotaomicron TaxID=818 RepID=UPI00189A2DC3|nr:fimbrillin family protein [Bacteroides thetaiotaomicron]MDC2167451.1 fimbrillin family protein [Bacteroides thetaiotaomicron]